MVQLFHGQMKLDVTTVTIVTIVTSVNTTTSVTTVPPVTTAANVTSVSIGTTDCFEGLRARS